MPKCMGIIRITSVSNTYVLPECVNMCYFVRQDIITSGFDFSCKIQGSFLLTLLSNYILKEVRFKLT